MSQAVENSLKSTGVITVRLGGIDRFATWVHIYFSKKYTLNSRQVL